MKGLLLTAWAAGVIFVLLDSGNHIGLIGQFLLLNLHQVIR